MTDEQKSQETAKLYSLAAAEELLRDVTSVCGRHNPNNKPVECEDLQYKDVVRNVRSDGAMRIYGSMLNILNRIDDDE